MTERKPRTSLKAELETVRARLEEAEATLSAIRQGDVDALIIAGPTGERVFTLKGADHSYRTLVETMNEGAATVSAHGTILYVNSCLAELLRLTTAHLTGKDLISIFPEEEKSTCLDLLAQALHGRCQVETQLTRADGTLVPVLVSANMALIDDATSICLVVTDLGAQKRNEEIVAQEKLARSILEQAGEAIVVCDPAGVIIRANQVARALSPIASAGVLFNEAFRLTLDQGTRFSIQEVVDGKLVHSVEAKLIASDGDEATVLVSAGPLMGGESAKLGAVVTLTDITERKGYELQLKQQAEDLARSNADLERFAFAASHDLQEPLRMITTYTELLTRTASTVNPDAEMFAGFIQTGASRMKTLIKDLLTYSRVIHAPSLDFRATDMEAVLQVAVSNLELQIRECGAEITHDPLPPVFGEDMQLALVMQNLISNALKYCNGRKPTVHISVEPGQERHVFCVIDNGVGIAAKYKEQIFGLFKRLHGREVPGSGIGLSVCRRIVELHGGRIWVESVVGDGSSFYFTLPAVK